jgi:hypothetical protein
MIRGTTAQFKFKLPYSIEELDWIRIKFWQPKNQHDLLPITKVKSNCEATNTQNEICVSLNATETSYFSDKYKAIVQLRAQPVGGTVFGSKQQMFTVYPMSDDIIDSDVPSDPGNTIDDWTILNGGYILGE